MSREADTSATDCIYCDGDGCSECDGTGKRYATHINAGDGLTAVVHGNAPLTDEAADAITAVVRSAFDSMGPSTAAPVRERCCGVIWEHGGLTTARPCHDCPRARC